MSQIDNLLNFVAGNSENRKVMSKVDDDVFSWLLINCDLFTLNIDEDGHSSTAPNSKLSSMREKQIGGSTQRMNMQTYESTANSIPSHDIEPSHPSLLPKASEAMTEEERKQLRLERNREIARNCRKRQREKMAQMEEEVKRLREEHEELIFLLRKGVDSENRENERRRQLKKMREMKDTASEEELKAMMEQYIVSWQDYGEERRRTVKYHLDRLKTLLLPTNLTKALQISWNDTQEDNPSTIQTIREYITDLQDLPENEEFHNPVLRDQGIWSIICKEMNFTIEQQQSILGAKGLIHKQRKNLQETLELLNELQRRINDNMVTMKEMVERYMNILKPSQQIAFLTWIEDNQACMYMLNSIWMNKNTSQTPSSSGVVNKQ